MIPVRIAVADRELGLSEVSLPLDLATLVPGRRRWMVEIGVGKGAYLLRSAAAERDETAWLGIEIVSKYYRLVARRARRRGLDNVVLMRGEALYLASAVLPRAFASSLHVYHPDPWPKARHNKRRLFDRESVDLLLGLLEPGGEVCFATDHAVYGEVVRDVLTSHPGLEVGRVEEGWPDGPRTHYEARFDAAGAPILRLRARLRAPDVMHPDGWRGVVAATRRRQEA